MLAHAVFRHVPDRVGQAGVLSHLLQEERVGGDDGLLFMKREGEIEAVVGRVVQIDA